MSVPKLSEIKYSIKNSRRIDFSFSVKNSCRDALSIVSTVEEIMTKEVSTVTEDTPSEQAARIMADNKIGGLPVMRGDKVVGIITETDLFKLFLELLGAREEGVRVTMLAPDVPGELAKITKAIADAGGNIVALGTFAGEDPSTKTITIKVQGIPKEKMEELLKPYVEKIEDIRECHPS